jgi:neutral ceramidase
MNTIIKMLISLILLSTSITSTASTKVGQEYLVGYGKSDITYTEQCLGLFGWGKYSHRIGKDEEKYVESRLYSRVVAIKEQNTSNVVLIIHADLGAIYHDLKASLVSKIQKKYPNITAAQIMITATHTHNAMGGLGKFPFTMATVPGFKADASNHVVNQMYKSVEQALNSMHLSTIEMKNGRFSDDTPVAFNRAVKAHNRNPEVLSKRSKEESHLAINRNMELMQFVDTDGNDRSFINWFGAHPIGAMSDMNRISSASKGFAAVTAEESINSGKTSGNVALFTQAGAGDVNVQDFHNPERFTEFVKNTLGDEDYDIEKTSIDLIQWNGTKQADKALNISRNNETTLHVSGAIDYELFTINMSQQTALSEFSNGDNDAKTGRAAEGLMRLNETNFAYDSRGERAQQLEIVSSVQDAAHNYFMFSRGLKEQKRYYDAQNKAHLPKHIATDFSEKTVFHFPISKENSWWPTDRLTVEFFNLLQSQENEGNGKGGAIAEIRRLNQLGALNELAMVPEVLPMQLFIIGNIAIAGVPFEITTVAHQRLQASILEQLAYRGVEQVLVSAYANDYASYMTTYDEYQESRYEGHLTMFGKHQLGAVQSAFKRMTYAMSWPKFLRWIPISPNDVLIQPTFSAANIAKRTNIEPLVCDITD